MSIVSRPSPNYTPGRTQPVSKIIIQIVTKLSREYNRVMKKIRLGNGSFTLVDNDYQESRPTISWQSSSGYAKRQIQKTINGTRTYEREYLHRLVAKAKPDEMVDHINQDKLDNRRKNLRATNKSQNAFNSKIRKDNTSGYRGVTWHKKLKKWMAQANYKGQHHYIGVFKTPEEAHRAYTDFLSIRAT